MATVSLCPTFGVGWQGFTTGGLPLNAGYIDTFGAGGTTPTATYTTSAGNVQNANPIVLGADGRPPSEIWLVNGTAYRFDLYDSAGTLIKTYDNISGIAASISGTYLPTAGGTMSGNIAMGTNKVTGLAAATANGDAVRYEQSPAGILTGKGALITASAANTPAALTVGTNGYALIANSSAANGVNWAFPVMRSYIAGCTMSTAGSSATMSIAAGLAVDSTNVSAMVLAAIGKTTSAWAVGTAQGGLDTGSIANDTWYAFYVIQRTDTGVVDVVFSTNGTNPTMPANYTLYRRIGWGKTNGSAQWILFYQYGDRFIWSVPVRDISGQAVATANRTARSLVSLAPSTIGIFDATYVTSTTGTNEYVLFTSSDMVDTTASSSQFTLEVSAGSNPEGGSIELQMQLNSGSQVYERGSAAGAISYFSRGWIDIRGNSN